DRSVQSARALQRLAERARLGSLGPERQVLQQWGNGRVELVHRLLAGDLLAVEIESGRALEAEIVDRLVAHALDLVEEILVLQRLVEAVLGKTELQRYG